MKSMMFATSLYYFSNSASVHLKGLAPGTAHHIIGIVKEFDDAEEAVEFYKVPTTSIRIPSRPPN